MFTNITRTTLCITAFSIASLMAAPLDATKTESLDWNWKFARFGKMPDGSTQPEPGKAMGFATATSEESGNPADNAVDGDKSTRWCADGGKSGEKITVDMGRPVDVKTVSSMLGHYSAGFTLDTYAHITTDAQLKAAQTMGSILSRAV